MFIFWIVITITLFHCKCVVFQFFQLQNQYPLCSSDGYCKPFVCLLLVFPFFVLFSYRHLLFLTNLILLLFIQYFLTPVTAALPTVDKLSSSVTSIVLINLGWYFDLGMPMILSWWKLSCYWGRLWGFHFQLDSKFPFLLQGYSDFDAVSDGFYCH